jgi:hypothetical protein
MKTIRMALRNPATTPNASPRANQVARYYRWKKNEWGASAETLRDHEAILAKLASFHADLELVDFTPPVGTERLPECWDWFWGERSARPRAKVRSVWIDFFGGAYVSAACKETQLEP